MSAVPENMVAVSEELRAFLAGRWPSKLALHEQMQASISEIAAERDALRKYAQHIEDCSAAKWSRAYVRGRAFGQQPPCDCGLNALLASPVKASVSSPSQSDGQ